MRATLLATLLSKLATTFMISWLELLTCTILLIFDKEQLSNFTLISYTIFPHSTKSSIIVLLIFLLILQTVTSLELEEPMGWVTIKLKDSKDRQVKCHHPNYTATTIYTT